MDLATMKNLVNTLLEQIGEDPTRPGLEDTPRRVALAWLEWTSGYDIDPASVFTTFKDGAENVDEMVLVRNIPFYSHCEHHLAPFFGRVSIGYIPNGRIVGLSKLNRLVGIYSRRLQVQERLTTQIADALTKYLAPVGVAVLVSARHLCMESRGVQQQGHNTVTSALRGAFRKEQSTRSEFMRLVDVE